VTRVDLQMLVFTPGGRERTERDFRSLLGEAGFELRAVFPTPSLHVLETVLVEQDEESAHSVALARPESVVGRYGSASFDGGGVNARAARAQLRATVFGKNRRRLLKA
jgi:hypothetical protein